MLSVGEYWFSWVLMPFLIISCTVFIFVVSHLCLHFCTGQQNSCVCRQITAFHLQPLPIIALMSSVTWLQRIESNWMESFLALNPVVFFLGEITHSGLVVSASDCSARTHRQLYLSRQPLRFPALGVGCTPLLRCLGRLKPFTLRGTVKWVSSCGLCNNNSGDVGCGW